MNKVIEFNMSIAQTKPESIHNKEAICPFCDVPKLENILDKKGPMIWLLNKYPVLEDTWQTIIIESNQCHSDFSEYSADYALELVQFSIEKWQHTRQQKEFRSVLFYRNYGSHSGGSIRHPHSQIVGLHKYDYHEDIHKEQFEGHAIINTREMEINLSTKPIAGFFEFNFILSDWTSLPLFVHYMQRMSNYALHGFSVYCHSYNIFYYYFDDDRLYVKIIPRMITNPLFVGYKIPQVSHSNNTASTIAVVKDWLMERS